MSSRFLLFSFILPCLFFVSACKKDSTPPVITLTGAAQIELPLGVPATDPGATANDDKDGDISSRIKSDWANVVNTDVEGTYLVTYSVMDNNRNQSIEERTVVVKFGTTNLFGTYEASYTVDGGAPSGVFSTTVSAGGSSDQCLINPFMTGILEIIQVKVNLLTNQVTINFKDGGITYYGSGTISNTGKTISLSFTGYSSGSSTQYTYSMTRK